MRKTTIYSALLLALLFCFGSFPANAQQLPKVFGRTVESANPDTGQIRCATTEYEAYLQEQDTKRESRPQFEAWLAKKIQESKLSRNAASATVVITIPVVVHVIHNGDDVGSNENIADDQVLSQITVLNQDYRRLAGTPGFNIASVGADVEIEFCMAQTDPDGNLTTGIDRVNLGQEDWPDQDTVNRNVKQQTSWDSSRYFNIWVVNFGSSDLLGYAQFPSSSTLGGIADNGGNANTDGVVIGYRYFGSEAIFADGNYGPANNQYRYGRTATHEIGHFLGLVHIWGDNNICEVNAADSLKDYCPDTPASNTFHYYCPITSNSCPDLPGLDMVRNYMDYSDDSCMNIFTANQKTRIRTVLQNSPRRASLITSTVCQPPTSGTNKYKLQGLKLYPNPTQGNLTIAVPNNDLPDSYTIYNSLGQAMSSKKINSPDHLTINTGSYSTGVYFIQIDKGEETKTLKFIKN